MSHASVMLVSRPYRSSKSMGNQPSLGSSQTVSLHSSKGSYNPHFQADLLATDHCLPSNFPRRAYHLGQNYHPSKTTCPTTVKSTTNTRVRQCRARRYLLREHHNLPDHHLHHLLHPSWTPRTRTRVAAFSGTQKGGGAGAGVSLPSPYRPGLSGVTLVQVYILTPSRGGGRSIRRGQHRPDPVHVSNRFDLPLRVRGVVLHRDATIRGLQERSRMVCLTLFCEFDTARFSLTNQDQCVAYPGRFYQIVRELPEHLEPVFKRRCVNRIPKLVPHHLVLVVQFEPILKQLPTSHGELTTIRPCVLIHPQSSGQVPTNSIHH